MSQSKTHVLITGCSDGGIGSALAEAFHKRGVHVIATARSVGKMSQLEKKGITTLPLDIDSAESINTCVKEVSSMTNGELRILVNNAGKGFAKPLSDVTVADLQGLFQTNVFSTVAVTNAFLPLLIKSASIKGGNERPMIVNNTSIVSVLPIAFQAVYNASKAALSSLTDTLRLELEPFGINVVDLKTGGVRTRFFENVRGDNNNNNTAAMTKDTSTARVQPGSIYYPARSVIDEVMKSEQFEKEAMPVEKYAESVVAKLLRNPNKPSVQIWYGTSALIVWLGRRFLPFTGLDPQMRKFGRLAEVEKLIKAGNFQKR